MGSSQLSQINILLPIGPVVEHIHDPFHLLTLKEGGTFLINCPINLTVILGKIFQNHLSISQYLFHLFGISATQISTDSSAKLIKLLLSLHCSFIKNGGFFRSRILHFFHIAASYIFLYNQYPISYIFSVLSFYFILSFW